MSVEESRFRLQINVDADLVSRRYVFIQTNFRVPDRELDALREMLRARNVNMVVNKSNKTIEVHPMAESWLDLRELVLHQLVQANANALRPGGYDVEVHETIVLAVSRTFTASPQPS